MCWHAFGQSVRRADRVLQHELCMDFHIDAFRNSILSGWQPVDNQRVDFRSGCIGKPDMVWNNMAAIAHSHLDGTIFQHLGARGMGDCYRSSDLFGNFFYTPEMDGILAPEARASGFALIRLC